jgi:peptidoglycan-associated lipoprotein
MRRAFAGLTVAVALMLACRKTPPAVVPAQPTAPPPAPEPTKTSTPPPSEYERIRGMEPAEIDRLGLFSEAHFDLDKSDVREADKEVLRKDADVLKKFDFLEVRLEGYCDERGTAEYNIALGDRRAKAVDDYLVSMGVSVARVKTVSYGKESSLCSDHNEECWARNRRVHFKVVGKSGH